MDYQKLPLRWCVYAYDDGKFKVVSLFKTVPNALTSAEEQIRRICAETGAEYNYNGHGDVKAYIANKDGKILTARLVKTVPV